MRGRIIAKAKQCTGCRSCQLACALTHSESQVLLEAIHESPGPLTRVHVVAKDEGKILLVRCQNCKKPKCVEVCATGALSQTEDGRVVLDEEKCTACGECVEVCPFGAIWIRPDGSSAYKCDLCIERLDRDELPACVEACPTGALTFRPAEVTADATQ